MQHDLGLDFSYENELFGDTCGVNRMNVKSIKSIWKVWCVCNKGEGMNCGTVEVVDSNILRYLGHLEWLSAIMRMYEYIQEHDRSCGCKSVTLYKMGGWNVFERGRRDN